MGACLISKGTVVACHFTMITFCLQCTACVGVLKYAACILLFSQYIDATLGACMQALPYAYKALPHACRHYHMHAGLCQDYAMFMPGLPLGYVVVMQHLCELYIWRACEPHCNTCPCHFWLVSSLATPTGYGPCPLSALVLNLVLCLRSTLFRGA